MVLTCEVTIVVNFPDVEESGDESSTGNEIVI